MKKAVGFMSSRSAAVMRWRVLSESTMCMDTMSLRLKSSSLVAMYVAPPAAALSGVRCGDHAMTSNWNALAIWRTRSIRLRSRIM